MANLPLGKANDNGVVSFSTTDILVYLFKESVKEKQFTDQVAYPLAHLDSQIAQTGNLIKEHLMTEQKQEWDAVKTLLAVAKDSPKRKELAQILTELEEKATNLITQGELLLEQSHNLTSQFWNTLAHSALADKQIPSESINHIKRALEDLNKKAQLLIPEEDSLIQKFNSTKAAVENMTGRSVNSIMALGSPKIN